MKSNIAVFSSDPDFWATYITHRFADYPLASPFNENTGFAYAAIVMRKASKSPEFEGVPDRAGPGNIDHSGHINAI